MPMYRFGVLNSVPEKSFLHTPVLLCLENSRPGDNGETLCFRFGNEKCEDECSGTRDFSSRHMSMMM